MTLADIFLALELYIRDLEARIERLEKKPVSGQGTVNLDAVLQALPVANKAQGVLLDGVTLRPLPVGEVVKWCGAVPFDAVLAGASPPPPPPGGGEPDIGAWEVAFDGQTFH
jgi:hypothetical protein